MPRSRLWLALRLTDLPLNALGFDSQGLEAVAVVERQRVLCANAQAAASGIRLDMDITTAQLLSDCELHPRERAREQEVLTELCERLYRFTPHIETYQSAVTTEAGVLLELSRCLKLFGGLHTLTGRICADLEHTHYRIDYGLAHTATGAWLLSYQNHPITGQEDTELFNQRLKQVPVQRLHDYPQAAEALAKTGFETLGDVARQIEAQSISSLKKRLGGEFARYICSVFAIEQDFEQSSLFEPPAPVYQPTEHFYEQLQFDYPVRQVEQLQWPMENMLQKLTDYLRKRQLQCQQIEWHLYDIHRNTEKLRIYCDYAQSDWHLLHELTVIQLEHKPLPFEVDTLELTCRHTTPAEARNLSLGLDHPRKPERSTAHSFALTAAKLKARLGDHALYKVGYEDSHLPEQSNATLAVNASPQQQLPTTHRVALRPTWLFDSPQRIEERLQGLFWRGYLRLLAGPERIEGNWWQARTARDYYLAERQDHLRLWVFLDLYNQQWYVQGVFG